MFVATQVTDWNNARLERAEYQRAVERLDAEITANLAIIDGTLPEVTSALGNANRALDTLQTCADSAENVAAVNAVLHLDPLAIERAGDGRSRAGATRGDAGLLGEPLARCAA